MDSSCLSLYNLIFHRDTHSARAFGSHGGQLRRIQKDYLRNWAMRAIAAPAPG